ncbi:AAA family ATPase [soil metagenome]
MSTPSGTTFGTTATAPRASAGPRRPPAPQTLEETGLGAEAVHDLILKTLYVQGARTGQYVSDQIRLPFPLLDERLHDLQQRILVEVRGTQGHGRGSYVYDLTAKGRERAREAMDANQYVGAAPVPLNRYCAWVEAQTIRRVHITVDRIQTGFSHLVLCPEFVEQLGPAINSAKSMFLYGDSGNGKTNLAESIARMLGGDMYVPYAVDIEGQVMVIHDPVYHRDRLVEEPGGNGDDPEWLKAAPEYDRRFARVARPVVFTGGELTLEQLDLQYDPTTKLYQAPFQVKANGGVLIIDDFGRQRVRPRDLLNRWIVPLEKRLDFLTLHTGHKFPVPFDCLLIFATNLNPAELVDEAFLRRIHYKIHVPSPDHEQYVQIFRRCCVARQIPFTAGRVAYIYKQYYERIPLAPRSCHPRDILDHLCDTARYLGVEPELTIDLLDRACKSYFLDMPDADFGDPSELMNDERREVAVPAPAQPASEEGIAPDAPASPSTSGP